MRPFALFQCLLAGLLSVSCQAAGLPASAAERIEAGMSPQGVIEVLGEPDRVAVFEGKYLRDVPLEKAASSNPEGRFVLIYRDRNLNVWFTHGRATGLTEGGGAAAANSTDTPDHSDRR